VWTLAWVAAGCAERDRGSGPGPSLRGAVRLVDDTGLHCYRWSTQQAIDSFADAVGCSPQGSAQRIDVYLYQNGRFTAYKIGQPEISELCDHVRQELGDLFDGNL